MFTENMKVLNFGISWTNSLIDTLLYNGKIKTSKNMTVEKF